MITVVGGKLTTYRSMAKEVVDRAVRELRFREGRPRATEAGTDEEPLPGGETDDFAEFRARGLELGVVPESVEHLIRHYGTEAAGIYNLGAADRRLLRRLIPPHPAIEAEVLHAVRRELAQTVEDVMVRRLHLYFEHAERGVAAATRVAELMGRERGWDDARIAAEAARYVAFASAVTATPDCGDSGTGAAVALGLDVADDHPSGHSDTSSAPMAQAVEAEFTGLGEGERIGLRSVGDRTARDRGVAVVRDDVVREGTLRPCPGDGLAHPDGHDVRLEPIAAARPEHLDGGLLGRRFGRCGRGRREGER